MSGKLIIPNTDAIAVITNNTCNLTCNNCGTLQNYNFTDTYTWEKNAEHMKKWAEIAYFPHIDLLGGEPLLNPDIYNWGKNVKELWPDSVVKIQTNGTLLHLKRIINVVRKLFDLGVELTVSTHTKDEYELHRQYLWNIVQPFKDKIKIEQTVDRNHDAMDIDLEQIWVKDGRQIIQHILVDHMFPNYIKEVKDNTVILDDSDPVESHNSCPFSTACFTIQDGLFYKCPLVFNYAIMKHRVNYEDRAYPLLDAYEACSPFDPIEKIASFFSNLHKPIEACRLCAYDKKANNNKMAIPVTFDKSYKKAFKGATKI